MSSAGRGGRGPGCRVASGMEAGGGGVSWVQGWVWRCCGLKLPSRWSFARRWGGTKCSGRSGSSGREARPGEVESLQRGEVGCSGCLGCRRHLPRSDTSVTQGRSWSLFARYVPCRGVIDKAAGAPRRPPTMALTRPAVVPMWQASKQAAPCEASPRYPWEWMSTVSSSVQCPGTPSPALDVKFNLSSFTEYLPVVFAMSTSQYVLRTSASNPAAAGGARRSCPSLCCRCRVGRTAAAWPLRGRCVAAGSANCLTFSILSLSSLSLVGRHTSTTRHTPFLSKTSSPRASSAPPLTNPDFVRCTRNAQTHVLVQTCKTKAELSSSRRQTTPDFPYTD